MIENLEKNKVVWSVVAILSLIASITGVLHQNIYSKVVSHDVLPGVISQDIITIIVCFGLLAMIFKTKKKSVKSQIIAFSFIGYLFYAYGIYVIEQIYNHYYILYMAIFALSFWSIIYGFMNLNKDILKNIKISKKGRYLNLGLLILIPLLFYVLWTAELLPLMKTGEKPDFTYSIYILDMVFILPSFIMSAVLIKKRNSIGYICAPILFFKAFTLLFSVGLGGFLKPLYNQPVNKEEYMFYIILSAIFLSFAVLDFSRINLQKNQQ